MKARSHMLPFAAVASLAVTLTVSHAAVVYQDTFDNDGIATNTGTGGGLSRYARQGDTWVDNGQLSGNSTGANDRGNVTTINGFSVTALLGLGGLALLRRRRQ